MLCFRTTAVLVRQLAGLHYTHSGYSNLRSIAAYVQGQSPEPRIREYFYYIDHQGQLFLDDTKMKNFVTCFKDKQFLVFFFSRLRVNQSGRYEEDFPFLSLCGRERNFLSCDDRPVVFTHMLQDSTGKQDMLSFCGGAEKLTIPFQPEALYMHPANGRVYHPCSDRTGSIGLVRSALAIELSPFFIHASDGSQAGPPTHFLWKKQQYKLTNELAGSFPKEEDDCGAGRD
ncbi:UPF0598 protein C8orf82 homolog [Corythoichthys intestinalis]|uniref:UPF0598 protein C8orf82 homolog n=1 Tax=Corythoichthys intestinalis TaxID=161448 RepID=UPI0025A5A05D|nr:UPF0598 protein C8orf82 homolog [Corythoichthys intestinalis]XP_057696688.1 UPF0598 protein C8orf82 homolog [Corythoichthys intestinalis]XP_061791184.1 UPF0598 protein C8orf82 homolog [Nerophis lumbriciformis]